MGTIPILDQNTMVDPNIPLLYKWFVNSNAWIFFQGPIEGKATNNIYDEVTGELLSTGALGKIVGSNKHFYGMIETNGEIAINGLDALEEEVGNNTSNIADVETNKATKQLIPIWSVPYRDEVGSGEPNTSRLATMTSPLPSAILIRDAEGKATFVGGTSASQGIVKSQLDNAVANMATTEYVDNAIQTAIQK